MNYFFFGGGGAVDDVFNKTMAIDEFNCVFIPSSRRTTGIEFFLCFREFPDIKNPMEPMENILSLAPYVKTKSLGVKRNAESFYVLNFNI